MKIQALKQRRKNNRKLRIRKKIFGTPERLRLSVYKSTNHIYVQLINDIEGKTILSASSIDKSTRQEINMNMTNIQISQVVGKAIAQKAINMNLSKVVFDRNGNIYTGRVRALAEAARGAGLEF